MINNRDSSNNWNLDHKEIVEIPYSIGTVVELKDNPSILASVHQYIINGEGIKAGLSYALEFDTYERNKNNVFEMPRKFTYMNFTNDVDCELTLEELKAKWEKTDLNIIGEIKSTEKYEAAEYADDRSECPKFTEEQKQKNKKR